MDFTNDNQTHISRVEQQDYFALTILWDEQKEPAKHYGFYFQETGLLEFSTPWESNHIQKMVLVLCRDFEVIHSKLPAIKNAEPVLACIDGRDHVDVDMLKTIVYSDGLIIQLAAGVPVKTFQYGNVYFMTDNENKPLRIQISNMSDAAVAHTVRELTCA